MEAQNTVFPVPKTRSRSGDWFRVAVLALGHVSTMVLAGFNDPVATDEREQFGVRKALLGNRAIELAWVCTDFKSQFVNPIRA